jgi:hypothetical protein
MGLELLLVAADIAWKRAPRAPGSRWARLLDAITAYEVGLDSRPAPAPVAPAPAARTRTRTRSRLSGVCRAGSLLVLVLQTLLLLHLWLPQQDHSGFHTLHTIGTATLAAMPRGAVLLLNGDLNHNVLQYLHACEGQRPDLDLLSLQLMTWEWFPRQRRHYPSLNWPGERYHPFAEGGFSLRAFLQANARRSLVLCGPWKEGDPSVAGIEVTPLGLCSLLHVDGPPDDELATDTLRNSLRALPTVPDMDAWPHPTPGQPITLMAKYPEDSWEHAWTGDVLSRLRLTAGTAAMRASQRPGDEAALELAWEAQEAVLQAAAREMVARGHWAAGDERAAGIVYGLHAKTLRDRLPALEQGSLDELLMRRRAEQDEHKMLFLWARVAASGLSELQPFVERRFNPYTGREAQLGDDAVGADGKMTNPFRYNYGSV